jgi:hypothetical protein
MFIAHPVTGGANVNDNVILGIGRHNLVYTVTDARGSTDTDAQFIDVGMHVGKVQCARSIHVMIS